MEAKAIAKNIGIPAKKCRLTINLIRGKKVEEADKILKSLNNTHSRAVYKCLVSAVANAENNLGLDKSKLFVKEAFVTEGQTLKRMRFGGRGQIKPIKKRSSHINIIVSEEK